MSGIILSGFVALLIADNLPSTTEILKTELKIPLRVYAADGKLLAEYGDERRKPTELDELPDSLIKAILASEDDRFFNHVGIDINGIIRAIVTNYRSGSSQQGASTITMQVARNYFLSSEKTYVRKLREIMLAFKLESTLSKQEILKLYVNKIFLGHRAYGFGAAAEVYFGKSPKELSLSEQATLAGLPKAPSRDNPISNPKKAETRRNYVLSRLLSKKWVTQQDYESAKTEPINAIKHQRNIEVPAPYVAEMVRASLVEAYGTDVYWQGWKVHTTIKPVDQESANSSLRDGLIAYDHRHGYRGILDNIKVPKNTADILKELKKIQHSGNIVPAIVLNVNKENATLLNKDNDEVLLSKSGINWAKKHLSSNHIGKQPKHITQLLKVGDVVYVQKINDEWQLSQLPQIQGAIVSMEPSSGKITALSGGFDYYFNKYNRVTQAKRQPGSGIKPFVYAAALAKGYNPSSLISGAPIVIDEPSQGTVWRPQNYSGKFYGPTSIRSSLTRSLNTVSVRLLRSIGLNFTRDYINNFGLDKERLPKSLSLALGAGQLTPLEVATAYATLANTGYLVQPYLIEKIISRHGETLYQRPKNQLCDNCTETIATASKSPRVMTKQDNFLIVNIMQDVIRYGTAKKALVLERNDLAGKTGTTNDYVDAWFSGFTPSLATTVWVGFDKPQTMGKAESGGKTALPIWIDYMRTALASHEEKSYKTPDGIASRTGQSTQRADFYSTVKKQNNTAIDDENDLSTPLVNRNNQTPKQTQTIEAQSGLF